MKLWQTALIALGAVWCLQIAGTWLQMRHYRRVMGGIARDWADGFVGAGNAKGTLGKGVILLLVTDSQLVVRRAFLMEGRSVFAKFRPFPAWDGRMLADLRADAAAAGGKGRAQALAQAIAQIERAHEAKAKAAIPPAELSAPA